MNTKQIEYVLELSNTLNFSRAAENLFVSQPSLTSQIQNLENEIGFRIFDRTRKGTELTPAGEQFCIHLRQIKKILQTAIEQGQNMDNKYDDALNVCIPTRACIYFLPQIMRRFAESLPKTALNVKFIYDDSRIDLFLRGEQDVLFARESELSRFSGIQMEHLFESHFYLITTHDDPLSKLEIITGNDLHGRTFMVGGDAPSEMLPVQNRLIRNGIVDVLNCHDFDTALINVAAGKGVCLGPGFANDHNGEFAWIPFDCPETMNCVLAFHKGDRRRSVKHFIDLAKSAYGHSDVIPL